MLTPLIKSITKLLFCPSVYQIWRRKFDRRRIYAPETKFKMAAAEILNYLFPVAIFNILPTFHYRSQPPYKIS